MKFFKAKIILIPKPDQKNAVQFHLGILMQKMLGGKKVFL